jgi:succinoglycan biosynthesis protein ExoV
VKIVYYKDAVGNFGDDLNALMWPRLLPEDVRAAPDTVMVGIGSLLDQARFRDVETTGKRVFVMGSGAAYGRLPDDWQRWNFLAVRGPLTAALIGQPHAAITDSAALLARLPALTKPAAKRDTILFMPHHRTLVNSRWREAATRAGMAYVDPQWTPERILACYGHAKLVVTEAMHGAIVADTLRIPWIPVMISPEVSIFKWRDWLTSVGLPYKPVALPPTAHLESFRYERISRLTRASGRSVAHADAAQASDGELLEDFASRYRDEPKVIDSVQAPGGVKKLLKLAISSLDAPRVVAAARALRQVAAGESFLSDDAIFADRLGQLEAAKVRLIEAVRTG